MSPADVPVLTGEQARRIAVRAQLLDAHCPTDLLDVVRRLTVVQHDQTAAVAPHADLLLWSRLAPEPGRVGRGHTACGPTCWSGCAATGR